MKERNEKLRQRIEDFVIKVILLSNKFPKSVANQQIIRQLIDAVSSVGANYGEACEGESARDFVHKIKISKKECQETNYWLRILLRVNVNLTEEISGLVSESVELTKIFASIVSKFKN